MAVPCTPAVAADVREEHERRTGRRYRWVRVRPCQPPTDVVNAFCGNCWWFIALARCHYRVEGWLVVEIYLGRCGRCGTLHWA